MIGSLTLSHTHVKKGLGDMAKDKIVREPVPLR